MGYASAGFKNVNIFYFIPNMKIFMFILNRNPRASCRGGQIPQMDLRAWKETERVKPTAFFTGTQTFGSSSHHYQDTSEYEAEEGSPARGGGTVMPRPEPEDDWVEELPRPMMLSTHH